MAMTRLGQLWSSIQTWLFPAIEDELGELDDKHREFIAACGNRGSHLRFAISAIYNCKS